MPFLIANRRFSPVPQPQPHEALNKSVPYLRNGERANEANRE